MKKLLLACTLFAVLFSCTNKNNAPGADPNAANPNAVAVSAKMCVKPPFGEKLNVAPQIFTVEPAGRTIQLKNGGSIVIPANAFVDKNGQPVSSPVEVRYREFHTPGEIIASGIPMKAIGPDGQEGQMQTAGMFDIQAFTGKDPVFITPGKAITVNMQSHAAGKYDEWFFDTEAGNWQDIGDSDVSLKKETAERDSIWDVATAPVKPMLQDASKPKLNFDVNYNKFPELKAMTGMVLQYAGNDASQDPANNKWIFNQSWEDIHLTPAKTGGQYTLTLSKDDKTYTIPVAPTLSGEAYTQALRDYKTQMADYKKSISTSINRQLYQVQREGILRTLNIGKLGIYNYDVFWKQPENARVLADFDFGTEKVPAELADAISVYLICKNGDMVVGYDKHAWAKFAYNPSDKSNKLLAILPGQKVAVINSPEFSTLVPDLQKAAGKDYKFMMHVNPKPVNIPHDLDQVLALSM